MSKQAVAVVALLLFAAAEPALGDAGLIVKPSAHDVAATADRLEQVLGEKGTTVLARIDHAEGARKVGAELAATQLLVFGNPKLGTPLMQSAREVGIDLPMKALVREDDAGEIWLAYNGSAWLAELHRIEDRSEIIKMMTGVLDRLTDAATKAD